MREEIRARIQAANVNNDGSELIAELEKLSDRALGMIWTLTLEVGACREPPKWECDRALKIETAIIKIFKGVRNGTS